MSYIREPFVLLSQASSRDAEQHDTSLHVVLYEEFLDFCNEFVRYDRFTKDKNDSKSP